MAVSDDQMKIGIVLGKILIKDEQEITDIVIYVRNSASMRNFKKGDEDKFVFEKSRKFNFSNTCI
jgi:Cu/Ag efflux protein CusF